MDAATISRALTDRLDAASAAVKDPDAGEPRLYALLDAAAVPMLPVYLEGWSADSVCLFSGELGADLAEVAPHLVVCDLVSDCFGWIAEEVVPAEGGIFLISREAPAAVKLHLKKFLMVRGPADESWFFRFYRPRIFEAQVRAFEASQRRQFFTRVEEVACFHPGRGAMSVHTAAEDAEQALDAAPTTSATPAMETADA